MNGFGVVDVDVEKIRFEEYTCAMKIQEAIFVLQCSGKKACNHGSYWVVYPGDAPESCVVPDGQAVNASCCTAVGPQFGLISESFSSSCFVISGLLGEDGGSLQSFLGCEDEEPVYGESCYNNGENGGLIPPGTDVPDTNVTTIEECGTGCNFQVSGNGCHKIRDFSTLPGFETDKRQVFIWMDEHCEGGDDTSSAPGKKNWLGGMILVSSIMALL